MSVKQLSIFVENKPGRLFEATQIIAESGIDLRALSLADTQDFGVLRIIVADPDRAKQVLRDKGCVVSVNPVVAVALEDKPGSLANAVSILSEKGINIEYMYAFLLPGKGRAYSIIRVEDTAAAEKILTEKEVELLSQQDLV